MIYGIEESTDSRSPCTKIAKFATRKKAEAWRAKCQGEFTFPGAANPDLPATQSNFHRTLRRIYEMPQGWRKPTDKELRAIVWAERGSIYSPGTQEVLARQIWRAGEEIKT